MKKLNTNNSSLRQMNDFEYYSSFFGACLLSVGIGILLSKYVNNYLAYIVVLLGIVIHGVGMFKIQKRNR